MSYTDPVAFAATRHRIVINLSGGKDGVIAGAKAMDAARRAGVADRVWTAHASLGPMEWPAVTVDGVRWPSASELAAQHSQILGVPRSGTSRSAAPGRSTAARSPSICSRSSPSGGLALAGSGPHLHRTVEDEDGVRRVHPAGPRSAQGSPRAADVRQRPRPEG